MAKKAKKKAANKTTAKKKAAKKTTAKKVAGKKKVSKKAVSKTSMAKPKATKASKAKGTKKAVQASVNAGGARRVTSTTPTMVSAVSEKVVEYKLFVEDSIRNLEDQVNYHIKKGWSPVGGVVMQGAHQLMQTMVRKDH